MPAIAVLAAFLCVLAVRLTLPRNISESLLVVWGVRPYRTPFLDTDTVLSALRCLRQGVDVFAENPCDPLGRLYDYSPAWLVLAHFPVSEAWTVPAGFLVDAMFLLSLFVLPRGRNATAVVLILLGALSTPVAFALERGNNDLVIFALAAAAAALAGARPAGRWLGYGCALLGGLLKYYPMLVMVLAFRERPRMFAAVTAVSLLLFGAFLVTDWTELHRALALIPTGLYLGDMFGARTLSLGMAELLGLPPGVGMAGVVGMTAAALLLALLLGLRPGLADSLARLSLRERSLLLAGSMLVIGCFFTAQNIGYRAIHLLLVLPGLTALAVVGTNRRLFRFSAFLTVLLLWSEGWRHWMDSLTEGRRLWQLPVMEDWDLLRVPGWLLREALWWWVITVLLTLSVALLAQSPTMRALRDALGRKRQPAVTGAD